MHRIRVGVIRGGHKDEHEISLNTGSTVMNNLPSEKYNVREIFIDRNLNWFSNGIKVNPYEVLMHVDVVFNALHGKYGEDGKVQHILETHNVPFTGSGSFSSSLGMNKFLSKQVYLKNNIKTPQYRILESTDDIDQKLYDVFRAFPLPLIVKPTSNGSSVGISLVNDFKSLKNSIINAFKHSDSVIIEEYINGREATCGVIDSFRNMPFYALPAIEIINDKGNFFNYNAKYAGQTEEIVP